MGSYNGLLWLLVLLFCRIEGIFCNELETINLRGVYVVDPAAPIVEYDRVKGILDKAAADAGVFLGVNVSFQFEDVVSIYDIVDLVPPDMGRKLFGLSFSAAELSGHKEQDLAATRDIVELYRSQVVAGVEDQISSSESGIADFVRPYCTSSSNDFHGMAASLINREIELFDKLRLFRDRDNRPIFLYPYNEYGLWEALGYGGFLYDVVVTNSPIISVEIDNKSVHVMARGGVSVGATQYSSAGSMSSYSVISLFPFISSAEPIVELRNGRVYSEEETDRYAGLLLVHELGHLLLKLGHPYNNMRCVMRPVELLQFDSWAEKLDPDQCRIGSSPEMTPGRIKILRRNRE